MLENDSNSSNPPIHVLALDGGGMRGLYTASVLECLSSRYAQAQGLPEIDLGRGFDLILGTSTGAILATGLATGLDIAAIKGLYCEHGPRIFPDPMPPFRSTMGWKGKLRFFRWCRRHLSRPGSDGKALKQALTNIFGSRTLGELYEGRGIGLCLTGTSLHQHRPVVFKTAHLGANYRRDDAKTLVDICLASAAAPLFLPLAESNGEIDGQRSVFADGGLWANNPVVLGLTEAMAMAEEDQPIRILSLGTCPPPSGDSGGHLQRGLLGWKVGVTALELSMNAQAAAANEQAVHLVRQLRRRGLDVEIYRCHETPPSEAMADVVGLDRAAPEATKVLIQHGADDGTKAFREVQQGTANGRLVETMLERAASAIRTNHQTIYR